MAYKFNSGYGAVICDQCKVIIDEDLGYVEYEDAYGNSAHDGDFCWMCITNVTKAALEKKMKKWRKMCK